MKAKYKKILEEIENILPCKKGDCYYTIERKKQISREIKEGKCGEPVVLEHVTTIGKEIVEHEWMSIHDIVRDIEHGRIGKDIFLTRDEAEKKLPEYWEKWWGKKP